MKNVKLLLIAVGLAFAGNASAKVYTYDFTEKISGSGPKEVSFATMLFDDEIGKFTLSISDQFSTLFHSTSAFVGALAFQYDGKGPFPAVTDVVEGGGVNKVTSSSKGAGDFDFRFIFGGKQDRLTSGESVSWFSQDYARYKESEHGKIKQIKIAGFDVEKFDEGALRVQGLNNGKSGWYALSEVTPVPEAKSYGMMLLGIVFMGFIVLRRKSI